MIVIGVVNLQGLSLGLKIKYGHHKQRQDHGPQQQELQQQQQEQQHGIGGTLRPQKNQPPNFGGILQLQKGQIYGNKSLFHLNQKS